MIGPEEVGRHYRTFSVLSTTLRGHASARRRLLLHYLLLLVRWQQVRLSFRR